MHRSQLLRAIKSTIFVGQCGAPAVAVRGSKANATKKKERNTARLSSTYKEFIAYKVLDMHQTLSNVRLSACECVFCAEKCLPWTAWMCTLHVHAECKNDIKCNVIEIFIRLRLIVSTIMHVLRRERLMHVEPCTKSLRLSKAPLLQVYLPSSKWKIAAGWLTAFCKTLNKHCHSEFVCFEKNLAAYLNLFVLLMLLFIPPSPGC